jgi:DNA-binding response OmpR family regulator
MNRKPTILIIDDEKDFCHFMRMNLESTNKYKIFVSTNARSGIMTAIRKKPDLVLLDIMMPNISGFEVLQKLKENINTTSIPVIMLTALSDDESVAKAMGLYSHEYIVKPVEMDSLVSKIDRVLLGR